MHRPGAGRVAAAGTRRSMPDIEFSQLTDAGRVRSRNEDAIGHWPHDDGLVFAVADGLGGHAAGEIASALALEVLAREMDRAPGSWPVAKRLHRAVREANLELYNKAIAVPELRGMGTTLTATAIVGGALVAAHVGDCRLIVVREGVGKQLTKDHTWVWDQVQYGRLSPEEARVHPRRHNVTRCLGRELLTAIDVLSFDLLPGDVLVQMSDGVHAALPEAEIIKLLNAHPPESACQALVRRSLEEGSADNLSVQVAVVRSCPPPASTERRWWRFGR
jgi:PPM family protein phosphatase